MTKINQEEYNVLKGLDDMWKWIARDKDGEAFIYEYKPYRIATLWNFDGGVHDSFRHKDLFQFIQWEDEEPYSIQGLIDEYLDDEYGYFNMKLSREFEQFNEESEETEVKNIEEVKDEVAEELEAWRNVEGGVDDEGIDTIMVIIDQLDEAEVLSKNWIDEHITDGHNVNLGDKVVYADELDGVLVPKQEEEEINYRISKKVDQAYKDGYEKGKGVATKKHRKSNPVIPKFVADWIEEVKKQNKSLVFAIAHIYDKNEIDKSPNKEEERIFLWMELDDNEEVFARAWLDGYEVKEEPLYRARLKVITDEFIASYLRTQSSDAEDRLKALEIGSKYIHEDYRHLSEFTEDELKRLDIWDSEQWEVEELEE